MQAVIASSAHDQITLHRERELVNRRPRRVCQLVRDNPGRELEDAAGAVAGRTGTRVEAVARCDALHRRAVHVQHGHRRARKRPPQHLCVCVCVCVCVYTHSHLCIHLSLSLSLSVSLYIQIYRYIDR